MNREILFKAKREDNGEWVTGNVLQSDEDTYIATSFLIGDKNEPLMVAAYKIIPKTLCQYTGLADKNDKKIWENDIVRTNQYGVDSGDGRNFSGFDTFSINFSDGSFCLMNQWRRFNLRPSKYLEVIENIFDNPELLEVEE